MKRYSLAKMTVLSIVLAPGLALAQVVEPAPPPGVPPGVGAGAATGAVGGAIVGGPVGAAVGGVAGAVVGGIAEASRPQFRSYVVERRHPSYRYSSEVVVGAELPASGVTYYQVPRQFGEVEYRYTIVNDRTVLVDPRTRRIIQIVD
ncbi:DUF1236 domain-containing protein [Phreatobacter stygius]|uniref:DUF1236 domain-containing protein n=1 Tax=Phreatobacter stygius TaxID=1940610 RepID=A0A4D7BD40_9HYPH|nr:DUF1236 domain-containing protein [Phreatobacter stygius]QCI68503.1 DUF1236 domain-containing protein [Phreatobacter stygius]